MIYGPISSRRSRADDRREKEHGRGNLFEDTAEERAMRTSKLLVSFLGVVSLGVIACGSTNTPEGDGDGNVDPNGGTIAPPGSTTPPADAGVTTVPPGCDQTQTPSQNACVVIEALGIFVTPPAANAAVDAGEGVADGTRARPYTKLQDAIGAAKAQKKRVYACSGDYAEQLTLADGVSMFSGLDCASWAPVATHASVKAPASPAVTANAITTPTRVEAFDFIAPDGTADAPSSIALVATASSALTLAHSTLHAGKGANGADGIAAVQLSNGTVNGANGISQYVVSASLPLCANQPQTVNTCVGAPGFSGGTGGAGGWGGHWVVVGNGSGGLPGVVPYQPPRLQQCVAARPCVCGASPGGALTATATTAQGGYFDGNGAAPGARRGRDGVAGTAGAVGAASAASISLDGGLHFSAGDGTPGMNGTAGQGGGGGMGVQAQPSSYNGQALIGGAGAGGGAGGCPGLAGTAGKGGGASIALLVSDSPLTLDTCILQTSDAGNGGKGTAGSAPTAGGSPGIDYANVSGTAGGSGGAGGASGWSGSGAGGWSVGIVSHGAAPTMNASTTTTVGKAGLGVDAIAANGKTVPATAAGVGGPTTTF